MRPMASLYDRPMAARRSATFTESVLWHVDADAPVVTDSPLPARSDVVVVGGGYAGLAAARRFAEHGRSVVVVEAQPFSTGASTRNGGMVIPELKAGPGALERSFGALGIRLDAAVNEAFDWTESLIATADIDCDYHRSGQLFLAHNEVAHRAMRASVADHLAHGGDVRLIEGDALREEIGSTAYAAGMVLARTGGLQPARFHAGLLRRCMHLEVQLQQRTRALAITDDGPAAHTVVTDRGSIRTHLVFVATNATADALLPQLQRRVLPIGSFIIATEVLDPALASSISPRDRMFVDSKNLLFYWRLTPDGRLAFGGRRSLRATTVAEATEFLYDSMLRVHPQLAGVAIDHAWGGEVALTVDRFPHVGSFGRVAYATGCNGSGVALMPWLGTQMADAMLGEGPPPPFIELRHRRVPLSRWRRAWTPIVGGWFRLQDRRR